MLPYDAAAAAAEANDTAEAHHPSIHPSTPKTTQVHLARRQRFDALGFFATRLRTILPPSHALLPVFDPFSDPISPRQPRRSCLAS